VLGDSFLFLSLRSFLLHIFFNRIPHHPVFCPPRTYCIHRFTLYPCFRFLSALLLSLLLLLPTSSTRLQVDLSILLCTVFCHLIYVLSLCSLLTPPRFSLVAVLQSFLKAPHHFVNNKILFVRVQNIVQLLSKSCMNICTDKPPRNNREERRKGQKSEMTKGIKGSLQREQPSQPFYDAFPSLLESERPFGRAERYFKDKDMMRNNPSEEEVTPR